MNSSATPDRPPEDRLWEQYGRAVDEYRFQVNLNWSRAQYFFVLNVAVLAAAVGLHFGDTGAPQSIEIALFAAGVVIGIFSILATYTQRTYYQATSRVKTSLEDQLKLGDFALKTTPGMGSPLGRLGRVHTFQTVMLMAIVGAQLLGLVIAVADAATTPRRVVLVVSAGHPSPRTIVVTRGPNGLPVWRTPDAAGRAAFHLKPGNYVIWTDAAGACHRSLQVTNMALQTAIIRCR